MLHEQFEQQQYVANSIADEGLEQIPAKCCKFNGKESFPLQSVAKTGEVAASGSKMLQIERRTGRKQIQQTRRRMAQERRGADSSLVSIETPY